MSIYDKASLVLIPSGTKTSKVYSQKPTNGDGDFTFSRSTAATRVNASGNIEKETENLIDVSQTFDLWSINGGASVDANVTTAPDGTTTADRINMPNSGNGVYRVPASINGNVYTQSIYIKNDSNATAVRIGSDAFPSTAFVDFNAVTGSVITNGGSIITSKVEDAGGGWYRVSWNYVSGGSVNSFIVYSINASASSCFVWGAQMERGLVARDYIETITTAIYGGITDNVPRLDYTDSSCPALLLEPQRTNLLPHSEYTGGYFANNVTWTYNAAESPEGVNNALLSTYSGAGYFGDALPVTAGLTYTFSLYLKGDAGKSLRIYLDGNGSGGYFFTQEQILLDGTWTRYDKTYTIPAGASSVNLVVQNSSWGGHPSVTELYSYGLQFEEGSYATSYIPTYGSAVTRNYDLAQMLSLNNTSPAWTLFFDVNIDTCPNYNRNFLEIDTSAASRRASFRWFNNATSNKIAPYFDVDAVYPFSTGVAENDTDNGKIVLRHDGNGNFSYFNLRNAVAQKRDYSGTPFTGSIIDIFGAADTTELESILFFPTALSDEECKTLVS